METNSERDQARALRTFAELVGRSPHNLVSRRARDELETRHIPECAAFARMLPSGPQRVLDLGSGGGFPGMVVAITRPDLDVHLLDATAKKTAFLADASAELGLDVTVHTGRAEELKDDAALAGQFDVVTARAVAPLDRLIGWAIPFVRPAGLLYAMKGARWVEELDRARPVIARLGASVVATPDDVAEPPGLAGIVNPRVVVIGRVT